MSIFAKPVVAAVCLAVMFATPIRGQSNSGDFLAGQAASRGHDYAAAVQYFDKAFAAHPEKLTLKDSAMRSYLAMGDVKIAAQMARELEQKGYRNPTTDLILTMHALQTGDYQGALRRLDADVIISAPIDEILKGWAHFGAGRVTQSMDLFDELAKDEGISGLALSQKALAHALVGDFESAEAIYIGKDNNRPLERTVHNVIARAQGLVQLNRSDDAVALLDDAFGRGRNSVADDLRFRISVGAPVEFDFVENTNDAIGELLYVLADALQGDRIDDLVLVYARFANYLGPNNIDALLMTANVLESLKNYPLATVAFDAVPKGHPQFISAEIGRATALRSSGQTDQAIGVLRKLADTNPAVRRVHSNLGDFLRQETRYEEAKTAYSAAIDLIETDAETDWYLYFVRAITFERTDDWPNANRDFRKSIELSPNRHQVLNFLGYSLVERQEKLDEALAMIQKAVDLKPDAGYIIDSLAWVLYRLGRYEEAVMPMERAVELMATDPVVNDHLGDVYWAVGRKTEAQFQWRRAASFITDDTDFSDIDPERVRKKLKFGLDAVLAEEGAPALKQADDH